MSFDPNTFWQNSPTAECLVTGCALLDHDHNCMVWGDLHKVGGALVFNACLAAGEAAWESPIRIMNTTPSASLPAGTAPFERRGVIVFSTLGVILNQAALARL